MLLLLLLLFPMDRILSNSPCAADDASASSKEVREGLRHVEVTAAAVLTSTLPLSPLAAGTVSVAEADEVEEER